MRRSSYSRESVVTGVLWSGVEQGPARNYECRGSTQTGVSAASARSLGGLRTPSRSIRTRPLVLTKWRAHLEMVEPHSDHSSHGFGTLVPTVVPEKLQAIVISEPMDLCTESSIPGADRSSTPFFFFGRLRR